jgi:hypothetical protein
VWCGLLLSAEDLEFFYFVVAMGAILDLLTKQRLDRLRASASVP